MKGIEFLKTKLKFNLFLDYVEYKKLYFSLLTQP